MHQLIIWWRQIICCAPINYLSGWLLLSPIFLGARLSYVSYINILMARSLDVLCVNPLEVKVSYVSSCTNSPGDRISQPARRLWKRGH